MSGVRAIAHASGKQHIIKKTVHRARVVTITKQHDATVGEYSPTLLHVSMACTTLILHTINE